MATLDSVMTKMRNLITTLNLKTGRNDATLNDAITALPVKRTDNQVLVNGATVTVPNGIFFSQVQKSVASATQATPSISVSSGGLITASATQSAGYVSAGTKSATKQLTTQGAKTVTPTTYNQTAVASGAYTTGTVTVKGDANLVPANIRQGCSIFGVSGSFTGGTSVPTTSVIIDAENALSDGYGVDVYYTILENGKMVQVHQYVESFQYVILDSVVVGSLIVIGCWGLYLSSSTPTNSTAHFNGTDYNDIYCFAVEEGSQFAFYE
jgi:hypothetical protein